MCTNNNDNTSTTIKTASILGYILPTLKHMYEHSRFQYFHYMIDLWCLVPLSAIFQLYYGDSLQEHEVYMINEM